MKRPLGIISIVVILCFININITCGDEVVGRKSQNIERPKYVMYIPKGINIDKKYPLVVALSPNADAQSMITVWKNVSEKYKWIILASKEFRNGGNMHKMLKSLAAIIRRLSEDYPVDKSKIIATGFSGGGMGAHFFAFLYPELISGVVVKLV